MRAMLSWGATVLFLLSGAALAQAPASPAVVESQRAAEAEKAPPAPEDEVLEVPEVIGRATEAERELREIEAAAENSSEIDSIIEGLPAAIALTAEHAEEALQRIQTVAQARALRDVRSNWNRERQQFDLWNAKLTERVRDFEESIQRLDEIQALWRKTRAEFVEKSAPAAVMERIDATLEYVGRPRQKVTARRDDLLGVQADIAKVLDEISSVLAVVDATEQELESGIFGADALPIWAAIAAGRMADDVLQRETEALIRNLETVRTYATERFDRIALLVLALLLSLFGLLYLRRITATWPEDDPAIRASAAVLARPYACALLMAYSTMPLIFPAAPTFFYELLGLLGLVPLARLLPPLLDASERKLVYALVIFYVVDQARELLAPLITLERVIFICEMASFAFMLSRLLRPTRVSRLPVHGRLMAFTGVVIRIAIGMLIVAVGANAMGSTALGITLGEAVFSSTYFALFAFGVYRVLEGVVVVALRSSVAARINMVRAYRSLITRRALRLIRTAGVLGWFWFTAVEFNIASWSAELIRGVLSASIQVGDLAFTLGGVGTFLLVFTVAFYFSRLLRFLLEQDVLPRMRLPRGVPYAITATLHYSILFIALIAAFTAAGIDLSKFSILAGALGVGVGFGLQNVVNNFVSGLILLFERPIQTGDVVEVGSLLGSVRRIGIRSSTLRTLDGAEVIVPNANLISDQVVNWTLSDNQRRIDINIGVAYGTNPERVVALLLQLAVEDERILETPEPSALFLGFGDSSLDFQLRAWTGRYAEWIQIRSDLNIAVYHALAAAGIEIPFPQRDLHLRSISDGAGVFLRPDGDGK